MRAGAYQPSMLDLATDDGIAGDGAALGPLAGALRRHELGSGAWVDHLPGWVSGSDAVLRTLLDEVDWQAERRRMYDDVVDVPRLLRWYAGTEPLPHPLLTAARDELSRHYVAELGEPFVTAGMCLYRDGRDSVAWHGDTHGRSAREDTMVAIVSFGSPRPLLLRPRGSAPNRAEAGRDSGRGGGASSLRFPLGHGDLVVMGGSCQRTWEHAVPKTTRAVGPRVSVQFRPTGVA
ncbi:alpha-ketoglutarate-dependent dioxygenase AlkB [Plantactinospora sp. B6F1]|uniref:alpha-ketoglutarate-dependent dioxygenase AlkB n=1 Tax=Plantactinospora sp. B6F1 TaxID=3158971 RepID=UPI00102CCED6